MKFSDLNLNKPLLEALAKNGFERPTTIQARAFSPIMSGRDVVGLAQTGTGKTLAYILPLLRLWKFSKSPYPPILMLVPTRELVVQVVEQIEMLTEHMNVIVHGAYGGANIKTNISACETGLDILVATPGRCYDLLLKGALKAVTIKKLVIDEVDEMLNLGFRTQLINILDFLPEKKQTLLFSATMTEDVEKLINKFFIGPLKIEAAPMGQPLEKIDQVKYAIPNFFSKVNLLKVLLRDVEVYKKVLVFTATKKMADLLAEEISGEFDGQFGVIHSNKSQNYRFGVIDKFKTGEHRIVIATDVVARGIDVSEVSHVFNFDVPEEAENYIHRIGRTGRADMRGNAISFIRDQDKEYVAAIEALMNYEIPLKDLPDGVEISKVLLDEELPKIKMKQIKLKDTVSKSKGAFHEKKEKNRKENLSRAERSKIKAIKTAIKRKSKSKSKRKRK